MLEEARDRVKPSACGCGTSARAPVPPVYVVGCLGFDFGTEARRDALFAANGGRPIFTKNELVRFIKNNPWAADSIIWTLTDDLYPLYAIKPRLAFGQDAYQTFLSVLMGNLQSSIDRISVPGFIAGSARLMNGNVVPVIEPDVSGLQSWSTTPPSNQAAAGSIVMSAPAPYTSPVTLAVSPPAPDWPTVDWVYWGGSGDRASDAPSQQIDSMLQQVGMAPLSPSIPGGTFSYQDGTAPSPQTGQPLPTLSTLSDGLMFTVTADAAPRTISVYVAAQGAVGTLLAYLADGSAGIATTSTSGDGTFVITINYQASEPTRLVVQWTMTETATPEPPSSALPSIAIQAASLQQGPAPAGSSPLALQNLLTRLYFELRNKGVTPEERARGFVATQAYFAGAVVSAALGNNLSLQSMSVAHSPLCRPGSECLDVTLTFFDPNNLTTARSDIRYTVDVSDVKPAVIGQVYNFDSF